MRSMFCRTAAASDSSEPNCTAPLQFFRSGRVTGNTDKMPPGPPKMSGLPTTHPLADSDIILGLHAENKSGINAGRVTRNSAFRGKGPRAGPHGLREFHYHQAS